MNFRERLAKKKAALSKKKPKKKTSSEVINISSKRKCGHCGEVGHNSRTCGTKKPVKIVTKGKVPVKSKKTIEEPKTTVPVNSEMGDKDFLTPSVKEILRELQELFNLKEIKKPLRDDMISFENFAKSRAPNKALVLELKLKLDPYDLASERYTLKKNLRNSGFRVPSVITTTDLVQLAMKRGIL